MNKINDKKYKHYWKIILPIGLGASFLIAFTVKPVRANIANFLRGSNFGDIYSELVSYFPEILGADQWVSLLEDAINDPCASVSILEATPSEPGWCTGAGTIFGGEGSISSILEESTGELGIPDTTQARTTIQEDVDAAGETSDIFISNPEVYGVLLGNVSDRAATNLNTQTVLSEEGQTQIKEEIDQSSEVVQTILDTADEAQSYESTQDAVKALVRINAQQTVITAMNHASALKNRTDNQFTNLNLANISRSLDEQNRNKQSQVTVDGFQLLNLTAQSQIF
jgi:hypothetical protein